MPSIVLCPVSVAVIEKVFCGAIVYGYYGKLQSAVVCHGAQANHAGGGFFCAADDFVQHFTPCLVNGADQIRTVVHSDMRLMIQRGMYMLIIGVVVFTFDGINRDLVIGYQRRRDIVLR